MKKIFKRDWIDVKFSIDLFLHYHAGKVFLGIVGLMILLIFLSGCSTISRVTNLKGQPPVTDLFPDEDDIARVIEEIKAKPVPKKTTIKWDGKNYRVPPDVWEKILNDKIYLLALKAKVQEFAEDYDPETIKDAMRQDMGTALITILIILSIMVY